MLRFAQLVSGLNLKKNGSEFCVGAVISAPTLVRHPAGIVIGGGVKIGRYCILLHGVTIGRIDVQKGSKDIYPVIGDCVTFGAYSAALGDIRIHDHTIIGAHSVLTSSTESSGVYVGIPAVRVKNGISDE
jgi:serine acetyltransferase